MLLNDFTEEAHVRNIAMFAQDRWTLGRFTVQGGLRYEHAGSSSPEQVIGPSRFVPTQVVFPAQDSSKATTTSLCARDWRWTCSATRRRR